jgi:hypothetical protein
VWEGPALEQAHDTICGARYVEGGENPCDSGADLLARVHDNPLIHIVDIAYRQAKSKVATPGCRPFRFLEAPGKNIEFGLGHGSLQTQKQPIVEALEIVYPIGIHDERPCEAAEFEQPLQVRGTAGKP